MARCAEDFTFDFAPEDILLRVSCDFCSDNVGDNILFLEHFGGYKCVCGEDAFVAWSRW